MNNYVIINADDIQSRIDELEITDDFFSQGSFGEHRHLKNILSNSIPLIPEIENAYDAGILHNELSLSFDYFKNRYMSHLKFKI